MIDFDLSAEHQLLEHAVRDGAAGSRRPAAAQGNR
jgi:hypothetical protein